MSTLLFYLHLLLSNEQFISQLQLQHTSSNSSGRSRSQDEDIARQQRHIESVMQESDKLREMLDRTKQELGNKRSTPEYWFAVVSEISYELDFNPLQNLQTSDFGGILD
jgi:hypothetical protein